MDYGRLISDAWRIAWRFKYLWLLGLFAAEGGGCGGSSGYSSGSSEFSSLGGALPGQTPSDVAQWVGDHWLFLAGLLFGLVVLGLVLLVVSIISTAGLVGGVDDAAAGRTGARLGSAWRRGTACFWRLLGMWVLVGLVGVAIMAVLVMLVALPVVAVSSGDDGPGAAGIAILVISLLVLAALLIPTAIAVSIALQWATRSLVLEGTGVIGSLGAGFRVLRTNLGASLLVWLLNMVLSIAVGIALTIVVVALGLPAAVVAAASWGDMGSSVLAVLGLLGLLVLAALMLVRAVSTTYFSAYWTLAYRQLTFPRVPTPAPATAWPNQPPEPIAPGPGPESYPYPPPPPPPAPENWPRA